MLQLVFVFSCWILNRFFPIESQVSTARLGLEALWTFSSTSLRRKAAAADWRRRRLGGFDLDLHGFKREASSNARMCGSVFVFFPKSGGELTYTTNFCASRLYRTQKLLRMWMVKNWYGMMGNSQLQTLAFWHVFC